MLYWIDHILFIHLSRAWDWYLFCEGKEQVPARRTERGDEARMRQKDPSYYELEELCEAGP